MIEVTPTITKVINESRREVTMSCLIVDDVTADSRTIVVTGKVKTAAEKKATMDRAVQIYRDELVYEALIAPIISALESDAKTYLEAELNG